MDRMDRSSGGDTESAQRLGGRASLQRQGLHPQGSPEGLQEEAAMGRAQK